MLTLQTISASLIFIINVPTFAQLNPARTSHKASVRQTVGITDIYITYSRQALMEEKYGVN